MKTDYYTNRHVQARILEFLGGTSLTNATARFFTAGTTENTLHRAPRPLEELPDCLAEELDISRSLWDSEWLLAHLDIEYVNFDFPGEPYLDPERTFELQRPVEWAIEAILLDYNIRPLHLLSGRGHHFAWQIRQGSQAFCRLASLGRLTPALEQLYQQPQPPDGRPIPHSLGAAFAGLGLVMEFLAHRIYEMTASMTAIPVEMTAVEVGHIERGREMISVDVSEYGDPLHTRVIRVPFSLYLKPWQQRRILGEDLVEHLPPVFLIPLHEMNSQEGIRTMHDMDRVKNLATRASTVIPDHTSSMENLITAYQESPLAVFHDTFYGVETDPPEAWPRTYDRMPLDVLPPCVRHLLEQPNEALLKPGGIRSLVRTLLALGWHPRHIAGLICSKYQRDFGWGNQWQGYDPAMRADFYTRLFSGLVWLGADPLVDFNCQSAKEEKSCTAPDCCFNLEHYRHSLSDRRTYERLAHRPFNRLLLPSEHL